MSEPKGRGGFWNRAARRSGGNRPVQIDVPRLRDGETFETCPECGNDMLPLYVTRGCLECRQRAFAQRPRQVPTEKP